MQRLCCFNFNPNIDEPRGNISIFRDDRKYDTISYKEVIEKELRVMDLTAITLCKENNLPIIVFDINSKTGLLDIMNSVPTGTTVSLKGEYNHG